MSKRQGVESARAVLEKIASFPLTKEMERDEWGDAKHGASSYDVGYSSWYIQKLARDYLRAHPKRHTTPNTLASLRGSK